MDAVSPESLVGETLSGWLGGIENSRFARNPRRVVPLRWDELHGCYIEVERVSLGEDNLILAVDDAEAKVKELLRACARPGWSVVQDASGMPEGWVLFKQAQIVAVPEAVPALDLIPLVPRSRSGLTMHGGFDLPGRLRKWSSLRPPEIVAQAVGSRTIEIRIVNGDDTSGAAQHISSEAKSELALLALADYDLSDGEYFALMFIDGENKPRSSSVIRLRSADTPSHMVEVADMRLVYSPESGALWPLSAGPANWRDYVNGARVVGNTSGSTASTPMRDYAPRERKVLADAARPRIHVGDTFAPDSCMVTGRHRFELAPALGGRPPSRTVEGECTTCGLVKRFAATPWAAARRTSRVEMSRRTIELPPVTTSAEPSNSALFDALCHVGQGSYRDLERIAGQVEGSGLHADSLLRTQEVLGHIDVSRDKYLNVSRWAVNAPTLIPVGSGGWALVGFHSRSMLNALRNLFEPEAIVESDDRGAVRVSLSVRRDVLQSRLEELTALGIEIRETSPAVDIAYALPALSDIEIALTRVPVPRYRTLEKWETRSAAWMPADSLSAVGAYRLKEFQSIYVVRSAQDIESGTAAVGTAQLVKHIANNWTGDPLVGYHGKTRSVVVPLGADLPALYGRALTLCSGMAPLEHPKGRLVQYPTVPRSVADVVFDRLTR
jgi:hypothetical protein